MLLKRLILFIPIFCALIPVFASAHEVYVLDHYTIVRDVLAVSPNPFGAIVGHYGQFFLWGCISLLTVVSVFFASIMGTFEKTLGPILMRLKKYAAPTARITVGVCLVASGYQTGLFGPELPFADFAGTYIWLVQWTFYTAGALIALGYYTRIATIPVIGIFALGTAYYGVYMLNYANYMGELLFALILGGGLYSLDGSSARGLPKKYQAWVHMLEPYAFPILRVLFGVAIIFASYYAKFLHSNLALDTITIYHLTDFFHFDPLFIVLGACIIETLIGIFYIIGFEIRWTALFFLFWLALSLLYFGEAVWPHLILLGLNLTFLFHGYDRYSVESYLFKHGRREPVL